MQRILIRIIRFYRYFLSPFFGQHCRFYPTCSSYALESITTYGVLQGVKLTLLRLSKCHPWHTGGIDPVPCCKENGTNG